ncbi:MAG: cell division protein FtsW [Thermoleophilia bacterium]|nr:cell division protein FtsW [Thermoleophilia bacterium]
MSPRTRELIYLVLVGVAVAAAYSTMYIAQSKVLDYGSLAWGGVFFALLLVAHLATRRFVPLGDPYLLPAAGLLCGLGVTEIQRLTPDLSGRQTAWLVIGMIAFIGVLAGLRDHHVLEQYQYLIGAGGVLALIITVSPLGHEVNGSQLWINFGPVNIQPGEFAKLAIVIFLAGYLAANREVLGRGVSMRHLGPIALFWGASLALLVLMNDFGTSLLFYGTFLLMLYVATARAWYLGAGGLAFAAGSYFVYHAAAHVHQRFDIWLDPFKDERGAGYQLVQGLFALADGGLFGRGLGQAFLVGANGNTLIPDAQTDFIFAALADELGWVGAVGVLLIYVVVAWRGYAIAAQAQDGFSKLLAFGLATTFALQSLIIVGGVVRLLPLTGQTLPFVSYGGSSVLANFLLIGILLVISHNTYAAPALRARADVRAQGEAGRKAVRT